MMGQRGPSKPDRLGRVETGRAGPGRGTEVVSTSTVAEATAPTPGPSPRKLPPVLGRLLSGSFWLALRTPLQAVFSLWTIPLILQAVGSDAMGAYGFAWGFGFFQFLFEFGM